MVEAEFHGAAFERIRLEHHLPFRCFFNSVGYIGTHWHSELELVMQVRGEILISTPEGVTLLGPGDLFLANPFAMHSLLSRTGDNLELALQIDLTDPVLLPKITGGRRFLPVEQWPLSARPAVRDAIIRIAGALAERDEAFALDCLSALSRLLAELVRHASEANPDLPSQQDYPVWLEHVRTIVGFLQDNYDHQISLDSVAAHAGLSRFYASHLVKAATGLSLQENLALIRTNRAVKLMFSTDAKLVDIAMDAGFSHLKYFNKYFRRLYGETPSAIRGRGDWQDAMAQGGTGAVRLPDPDLVEETQRMIAEQ